MNDALLYGETKNGFAYAVPIYEEDQITGALVACNSTEWIKNLLSQSYFEGKGFVAGNQKGTVYFSMNSDHIPKIGKMIPLSYPGYYLFLVVIESAADRQFDLLLFESILSNVIIALLFMSLAVILFVINNRHNKQLSDLAFVDPVTGGYSQVRFESEAENQIRIDNAGTYTFVSLNVANFKLINDTFGTADGNRILKYIHYVIRGYLKEEELICRSFADNFDLLVKTRSKEELLADIDKIARQINAFNNDNMKKYQLFFFGYKW